MKIFTILLQEKWSLSFCFQSVQRLKYLKTFCFVSMLKFHEKDCTPKKKFHVKFHEKDCTPKSSKTTKKLCKTLLNIFSITMQQRTSANFVLILLHFKPPKVSLKVQSCKLYDNEYMIALTQIANTEIFAFIAVHVFKLLTCKVLFINRKENRNC